MKKIIALFLLFASVIGYSQDTERALGCSADCFFNDCVVRCPSGSIPKCKCILGSFSSCSCAEMIGKTSNTDFNIVPKNIEKRSMVLNYLIKNNYKSYYDLFYSLFNAMDKKDFISYNIYFNKLENLYLSDKGTAINVETFINTLK